MSRFVLCITLSLIGVLSLSLRSAHALRSVSIPVTGFSLIGIVDQNGTRSVAVVTVANGNCYTTFIEQGWAALTDDIRLYGTSGADLITFATTTGSACGSDTISPLNNFNGWTLDIYGGFGSDIIVGGSKDTYVFGQWDDDALGSSTYAGSTVSGGFGNDRITGFGRPVGLYGSDGDDRLCANFSDSSATVTLMDGGSGTDNSCGNASTRVNVETSNCSLACTLL